MTIRLTENDLLSIVSDASRMVIEGRIDFSDDYIVKFPFPIKLEFTIHAIDREDERFISESDVRESIKKSVPQIMELLKCGDFNQGDQFKVVNRENCIVSVCSLHGDFGRAKIKVITTYIWDGRIDIDNGNVFYVEDESEQYLEAKTWNAEHRDLVISYSKWKRGKDIARQRKTAETEYWLRNNREMDPKTRMKLVNLTYDKQYQDGRDAIHDSLPNGEMDAIRSYFRDMDRKPLASKFSANRDLRAMDLMRKRREEMLKRAGEEAEAKKESGPETRKPGLNILGKIDLDKVDPKAKNKKRW